MRTKKKKYNRRSLVKLVVGILIVLTVLLVFVDRTTHSPSSHQPGIVTTTNNSTHSQAQPPEPADSFNKTKYSLTDPSSIWVITNKSHPLNPKNFTPTTAYPNVILKGSRSASNMQVSQTMKPHLESLFGAAKSDGYSLMLSSGYRSYGYQVTVYNRIVGQKGQAAADRESARPGYSEHQTGLAADVAPRSGWCDLSQCFGSTPEGKWLASNAYRYGFVIRYPQGKESVTGYLYEPWHIRFVGTELSQEMHRTGQATLEEFFGISGGTEYN